MALDRRPEVLQQNGLFHGGVIAYLIDNATTAAAGTMIDRDARARSSPPNTRSTWWRPRPATASPAAPRWSSPGRSLTVVDAKVFCRIDGEEKLVAVALATIANLDRKPGNEA